MASASSVQKSFAYDVFLSFRGEDTRKNFIDHLYTALENQRIYTYKDDEKMEKGEEIKDDLIKSIESSRLFIIVFSKNYASSSWCLDELAKIMECHKTTGQKAYPVFYDVEPTDVRKQSGAFGDAFSTLKDKMNSAKRRNVEGINSGYEQHTDEVAVGKWREALADAASLSGWDLKNTVDGYEAKLIQKIVEEISLELRSINYHVDEKLVGMESRIKDVETIFETDSNVVIMIGIKGMGGGGKTTLARAVYDKLGIRFEGRSFVENVREVSNNPLFGLKSLQKQVLSDILDNQNITVSSVADGKSMMRRRMGGKKVLVVLDDVDHIDQLEALAGEPSWFKPGSVIIITTRDEQVLIAHHVRWIRDVTLLSYEEAISLFNRYAFGKEIPNQEYKDLSRQVVHYAAGLPLTIKVLGSSLCGKNELEWKDALERLRKIPLKETMEKLEISYISLEDDYKEIFLDVACFLKDFEKDKALRILDSCGFHAINGLRVLELKSLITIKHTSLGEYLGMHDHIQEMGRNIVRRNHLDEPNKHSRLWINEEIENVLVNNLDNEATTRCIVNLNKLSPEALLNGFGCMKKLKFLVVYYNSEGCSNWKFDKVNQYFPNALRYLEYDGYPFISLPETFQANNLVALEMSRSKIVQLWDGRRRKIPKNLKYLKITHIKLKTLDCRLTTNLRLLHLHKCDELVELHMPISSPELESLELSHLKLKTLDLGLTPKLQRLTIKECHDLVELNSPNGCLKHLTYMDLSGCTSFKFFFLKKQLQSLEFDLITEFHSKYPSDPNSCYPDFELLGVVKEQVFSSNGNPQKLISLVLYRGTNSFNFTESIFGSHLRELRFTWTFRFADVPKDLDQLKCLEKLILRAPYMTHLPDSICLLKHLKYLQLDFCMSLAKLPEDLGQLECLEELYLDECEELRDVPNSISKMKCLKQFSLHDCTSVKRLPEEVGHLKSLKSLDIVGTGINHLPHSIFVLKGLQLLVCTRLIKMSDYTFSNVQRISEDVNSCYI